MQYVGKGSCVNVKSGSTIKTIVCKFEKRTQINSSGLGLM
jgi:hypothetical protein